MRMKYLGVDGCRAGWLCAVLDESGMDVAVFRSFREIWDVHQDASLILVDIPIGLPGGGSTARKADQLARRILGRRHSAIFSPGARSILNCSSYAAACEENRKVTGKKISKQYWGIVPKVKEVDSFMLATADAHAIVRESHPEVCFESSSEKSIGFPKRSTQGVLERLDIMEKYFPDSKKVYSRVLKKYLRREVARDDIVDAMILAITASESSGEMTPLPNPLEKDAKGLPMAIWFHDFERKL